MLEPMYVAFGPGEHAVIGTADTAEGALRLLQRAGVKGNAVVDDIGALNKRDNPAETVTPVRALARTGLPAHITKAEVDAFGTDSWDKKALKDAHARLWPYLKAALYRGPTPPTTLSDPTKFRDELLAQNEKTKKGAAKAASKWSNTEDAIVMGLSIIPSNYLTSQIPKHPFIRDSREMMGLLDRADLPGSQNFCMGASKACSSLCLVMSGQNEAGDYAIRRKTAVAIALLKEPVAFTWILRSAIERVAYNARKAGLQPYIRLNVFSDIPWEVMVPWLFTPNALESNPRFYDYTKVPGRAMLPNYDLTFSFSGTNEDRCRSELAKGRRMATVFLAHQEDNGQWSPMFHSAEYSPHGAAFRTKLAKAGGFKNGKFWGYPVINGDAHDVRPLDPPSKYAKSRPKEGTVVVGLIYKPPKPQEGRTSDTTTSFVVPAYKTPDGWLMTAITPGQEPAVTE